MVTKLIVIILKCVEIPNNYAVFLLKERFGDFPGGPVVENPLCNARDTSSIPGLGKFHVPPSH